MNKQLLEKINKEAMGDTNLVKCFLHFISYFSYFFIFYDVIKIIQYFEENRIYNKYIIADDYYIETGKKKYLNLAKKFRNIFLKKVGKRSIIANFVTVEKSLRSSYWPYEKRLKERILKGKAISSAEIKKYLLFKSSDIYMNSATFQNYTKASKNTIKYYHYVRALAVLVDDMKDVQSDLEKDNPNCIIMLLTRKGNYSKLKKQKGKLFSIINQDKVTVQLDELKTFFEERMKSLIIPKKFFFPVTYTKFYNENEYEKLKKIMNKY